MRELQDIRDRDELCRRYYDERKGRYIRAEVNRDRTFLLALVDEQAREIQRLESSNKSLMNAAGPRCDECYAYAVSGSCIKHGGDACLVMPGELLERQAREIQRLRDGLSGIAGTFIVVPSMNGLWWKNSDGEVDSPGVQAKRLLGGG
jgi:hypothetical protein